MTEETKVIEDSRITQKSDSPDEEFLIELPAHEVRCGVFSLGSYENAATNPGLDHGEQKNVMFNAALDELEELVQEEPSLKGLYTSITKLAEETEHFERFPEHGRSGKIARPVTLGGVFERLERAGGNGTGEYAVVAEFRKRLRANDRYKKTLDKLTDRMHANLISVPFVAAAATGSFFLEAPLFTTGLFFGGAAAFIGDYIRARGQRQAVLSANPEGNRYLRKRKKTIKEKITTAAKSSASTLALFGLAAASLWAADEGIDIVDANEKHQLMRLGEEREAKKFHHQISLEELAHRRKYDVVEASTNTKDALKPYRFWTEGVSDHLDGKKIHDELAFREEAIYRACETAGFDNPELITALYLHLEAPSVFSNQRMSHVRHYDRELGSAASGIKLPENMAASLQNNRDFEEFVLEKYIAPLMLNLKASRGEIVRVTDALALLVYTPEDLYSAKEKLQKRIRAKVIAEFYDSEGDVTPMQRDAVLYRMSDAGFPPKVRDFYFPDEIIGQNGLPLRGPGQAFVEDVILMYFLLKDYHQELQNKIEQNDGGYFKSGATAGYPKTQPLKAEVSIFISAADLMYPERTDANCQEKHQDMLKRMKVDNPHNIVHPGSVATVLYKIRGDHVTSTPIERSDPFLSIPNLNIEEEEFSTGDSIQIPFSAVPGPYQASITSGLTDNCRFTLTTTIHVTNKLYR